MAGSKTWLLLLTLFAIVTTLYQVVYTNHDQPSGLPKKPTVSSTEQAYERADVRQQRKPRQDIIPFSDAKEPKNVLPVAVTPPVKVHPQLHQKFPWFDPAAKYLLYQPSGGISNQLLILEAALLICKTLKRVCILPHVAPHTSGWWNYNGVKLADLLSMESVLDLGALEAVAPVACLQNITLKRFVLDHEGTLGSWRRLNTCPQCTISKIENLFASESATVLYFARTSMWQWGRLAKGFQFSEEDSRLAERSVRMNSELRSIAKAVSRSFEPYMALHIRFLDGKDDPRANLGRVKQNNLYYSFPLRTPAWFMKELDRARVNLIDLGQKPTLFIATSPKEMNNAFFREFKTKYRVIFSSRFVESRLIQNFFKKRQVPEKLKSTVLGIVEQLVCARSALFLGTSYSSFSASIRRMRRNRITVVDPFSDDAVEQRVLEASTACNDKLRAC